MFPVIFHLISKSSYLFSNSALVNRPITAAENLQHNQNLNTNRFLNTILLWTFLGQFANTVQYLIFSNKSYFRTWFIFNRHNASHESYFFSVRCRTLLSAENFHQRTAPHPPTPQHPQNMGRVVAKISIFIQVHFYNSTNNVVGINCPGAFAHASSGIKTPGCLAKCC